ncbi:unnamed protein product, partial [Cyprideis torosa]
IYVVLLFFFFQIYHVNAPGQHEGAENLPETYVYPTMDELCAQVEEVCSHFNVQHCFCFGVGFGANVLARFALSNPGKVDALCLVNCVSTSPGWIEWGFQKMNIRSLRSTNQLTAGALDYLLWHHFGKNQENRNHDLVQTKDPEFLQCKGNYSPHVDDTVTLNSRLNPAKSDWLKLGDCGMPLEEQPAKVSEALRLFMQGSGYIPTMSQRKLSRSRSMDSGDVTPPTHAGGPASQAPKGGTPIKEEPATLVA